MNNKRTLVDINELKSARFPLDELFYLIVKNDNVKYQFLVRFSSTNKNLICFGSGAYDPKRLSPPIFRRHSWQHRFEESVIYYNDPTLYVDPDIIIGWGVGKNDKWYLQDITKIISVLAAKNGVKSKNILFFGSSGGGFTALILSAFIKKSTVIVNNPQIFLANYAKQHFNQMVDSCFDNLDFNTILTKYGYRFDVLEIFKREKYMPNITYLVNIDSKPDISNQLIPFINHISSFEYFNDVTILLYHAENGHEGIFDTEETINIIKNHFRTSKSNQLEILETNLMDRNNQLKSIANTLPYRIAYFLHRFSYEFLKGNVTNKKNFLKWICCKLIKKESGLEFKHNPLIGLVKK